MKQRRKRCLILALALVVGLGAYGFLLFSSTYSPRQLQKAAGSFLGFSLGSLPADSQLMKTKQCNQDLFCLFESENTPYLVGFHPAALTGGRYRPFCLSQAEYGLNDFFLREGELCTYVLFGKRPEELNCFSVDVINEQGETLNRFYYAPKREDTYLLYVLQKSYSQQVSFRPSIELTDRV